MGKKNCVAAVDFPTAGSSFSRRKVADLPAFEFENSLVGVKKMLRWIDRLTKEYCQENNIPANIVEHHFLMESTGCYSRQLEGFILETRPTLKPIIENAALIHSYRKSLNLKNETDFLDAKGIAYYGSDRQPEYRQKNPEIYRTLAEMCRLRELYVTQLGALQNFYESLQMPMLKRMNTATLNPKQKISGTSIHRSKLSKAGSSLARKILYLDSTQAVKIDPYLAEFYHRLIVNGKSPKTAKCACMRKMLTILRAMVAANRRYTPELFTKKLQKTA